MNVKFYTQNLAPGEIARFVVVFPAPWGEHHCNAVIAMSQLDNEMCVLWPKGGRNFAHSPGALEMTQKANKQIMETYKAWRDRK